MPPANRQLIQVLPRLTPTRCGVSDQAVLLARELSTAFGIDAAFVVLNSGETCALPYSVVHCDPNELMSACLSLSHDQSSAVLVHVSGYGYAADGAPTLLAEAIAELRRSSQFRIASYFHELFANGMPWKSAFWHSRQQKGAIRRIVNESDLLVTNIEQHAKWLEREPARRSSHPVVVLPVLSAAGECQDPVPVAQRKPAMAVFGLLASRLRAYRALSSLKELLDVLGIKEIVDIGPESGVPGEVNGIPVRRAGVLSAEDLGNELSQTMFGFLSYGTEALAKSSILAGYCAQGTIPIVASSFHCEVDGLIDGVQLLSPRTAKAASESRLARCSLAGWEWYQGHNLRVHAATYARWLNDSAIDADAKAGMPAQLKEM